MESAFLLITLYLEIITIHGSKRNMSGTRENKAVEFPTIDTISHQLEHILLPLCM